VDVRLLVIGFLVCGVAHSRGADSASAGSGPNDTTAQRLVPFRHCQVGVAVGYSLTRITVDASAGPSGQSGVVSRWFYGCQVFPVAFLRLKGMVSNAGLSAGRTEKVGTYGQYEFFSTSNTQLTTYGAEACIMIPIFWNNGLRSILLNENGFHLTVGGAREWIHVTDKYQEQSPGVKGINYSFEEKVFNASAGLLYRTTFRLPGLWPKFFFEIGLEYCPLLSTKFSDSGTTLDSQNSSELLTHTISIDQEMPVRINSSLSFNIY
jgi:hypothetical protein